MAQLQKIMGFPELIWKSLGYMIYVLLKLCLENGKVFIETICRLPIPLFLSNSLCWMEPCRVDVHTDMHQQGPSYVKLLPARGDSERSSNRNNFHWDIETCETLEILLHSRNKCWSNWNGVIGKLPPPPPAKLVIPNISHFAPRSLTTNSDFGSQSRLRFYWCHFSV